MYGGDISIEFHLGGAEELVADLVVDALEVLTFLEASPGGEAVVELVAGELDLLAMVVVLDEADKVTGREPGIVEGLEGALGGEEKRSSSRRGMGCPSASLACCRR